VVTHKDHGDHMIEAWQDALNNPPKGYEVDSYQGMPGDEESRRRYIVVYKLIDTHIDIPSGRKFK